jgi:peptide chain release factor subunit 1
MDEATKVKLKRIIKELEGVRGRHTELISVYVPAGYNLDLIRSQLSQEQGTATNIKSKSTRKNVVAALEKALQELKLYKKTPENGLALFSGNASEREGVQDVKVWAIEPPSPMAIKMYRCDQDFLLEPLRDMLEAKYVYGLLVIDNKNAAIGLLKGKRIEIEKVMDSIVPGKYRAGGQSAARFERVRDNLAKDWYKRVAEEVKNCFGGIENLKGILIGGPGPTKEVFVNGGFLTNELRKKIIGVQDIGYTNEFGLQEVVERSQELLKSEEVMEEKKMVGEFLQRLSRSPDTVTYGEREVEKAIKMGAVEKVMISEEREEEEIDKFTALGKEFGAETMIISTETKEGEQLAQLGGFAAFLRFKVN